MTKQNLAISLGILICMPDLASAKDQFEFHYMEFYNYFSGITGSDLDQADDVLSLFKKDEKKLLKILGDREEAPGFGKYEVRMRFVLQGEDMSFSTDTRCSKVSIVHDIQHAPLSTSSQIIAQIPAMVNLVNKKTRFILEFQSKHFAWTDRERSRKSKVYGESLHLWLEREFKVTSR